MADYEVARMFRDVACRTLDKAEAFTRQGKPLPQDEIDAMTARIVEATKLLDHLPGWVVECGPRTYGPFLTATDASRWVSREFPDSQFTVRKLYLASETHTVFNETKAP